MSTQTIKVHSRSGKELASLILPSTATVLDLKRAYQSKFPKYYIDRQYFTIGTDKNKQVLQNEKLLTSYSLSTPAYNNTVIFKDLGPQIAWKTVFHVEYFGPILIHALIYYFPQYFYNSTDIAKSTGKHNYTQTVAFYLVILHYIKREFETHYIHRFSNSTMPILNIFKNSAHYWLLGGLFIAYYLYHPLYTAVFSDLIVNISAILFLLCEAGNLYCHIILRNLRKPGTKERNVPRGFLFEYTSCANYTFEVYAWIIFAIFTSTVTAGLFAVVSTVQIALWSIKKHKALKKEFGEKNPKGRKILFPFIW